MKVIVVGAVAGGATAASQIKRLCLDADITIYEKDRDMSFANCGLPYYIGDVVQTRDQLIQATPEQFKEKKGITVYPYHEVVAINADDHTIQVVNHQTKETFQDAYDYLILSPGCRAVKLPQIKDRSFVFPVRNLEDIDQIKQIIETAQAKNALVIGAGYISLEMVENLSKAGLAVTLLNRSDDLFKAADRRFNPMIKNILAENNITLQLNDEISDVHGHTVTFNSGQVRDYDVIIEAVGITPNTDFVGDSIQLNDKGYIVVDEYFETTAEDVYALGDAIETFYRHTGTPTTVALAWGAHRAANLIAESLSGNKQPFKGLLATNIVQLFNHSIGSTGIKESELKDFDYSVVVTEQKNAAGYMPDARVLSLAVYYRNDNRQILRACAFGEKGVDKRIDILATAIGAGLTIDDLRDVEIAYAPPYASPKDIINMIGYKAQKRD